MEFLWIIFWLAVATSFLFGIYCIIKKHIASGVLQTIVTITFTYLSAQIGINSGYSGKGETEFAYFLERLFTLKLDAVLLVVLLILGIGCNIYHIAMLQDIKNEKNMIFYLKR